MTLRFSRVAFQQPDETLMLPASIETLHVLRGVPSMRITQTLADYRRFLTKSEIRSSGLALRLRPLLYCWAECSVCTRS